MKFELRLFDITTDRQVEISRLDFTVVPPFTNTTLEAIARTFLDSMTQYTERLASLPPKTCDACKQPIKATDRSVEWIGLDRKYIVHSLCPSIQERV